MLFQVNNLAGATGAIAAAVRTHDVCATVTHDLAAGQIDVSAGPAMSLPSCGEAGHEASRVSEPRQIHVSGGRAIVAAVAADAKASAAVRQAVPSSAGLMRGRRGPGADCWPCAASIASIQPARAPGKASA
jgi:hypothetical protein